MAVDDQDALFGMTFPVAAGVLAGAFVIGAACNTGTWRCYAQDRYVDTGTGRAIIMKLSGQRIIARIR